LSDYSPGKIRALLDNYTDYLAVGKVPPLSYDSTGWHLCDYQGMERQRQKLPSDGMEAARICADLKSSMRKQPDGHPGPWDPLTKSERLIVVWWKLSGQPEWEAADMAGIDRQQARRTYREATVKMARNLGWKAQRIPATECVLLTMT
jgi:hypothetical protein